MADIKASLSLEFALRTEAALKSLSEIETKVANIEASLSKVGAGLAPAAAAAVPTTAAAQANPTQQAAQVSAATAAMNDYMTESKRAQKVVEELWQAGQAGFDKLKDSSNEALKSKVDGAAIIKGLNSRELEELDAIVKAMRKMTNLDKQVFESQKDRLDALDKLWKRHELKIKVQQKLYHGLDAILGNKVVGNFIDDIKDAGQALAWTGVAILALGKAWSDADKLLQHYAAGMYGASEAGVSLALSVSYARRELGATVEEVIKAADAVYFAGIRTTDTNQHFAAAVVQVGKLARAYGVSEEASAGYLAVQRGMSGSLEQAGARVEELAKKLYGAGLSGAEATTIFQKSTQMTLHLSAAFSDGGLAGQKYAKMLIELGRNAKYANVPLDHLAAILDKVTKGGPDAIMLMGKAAFQGLKPQEAYNAALNNFENIMARFKGVPAFLMMDEEFVSGLSDLSVDQYAAMKKEYELRQKMAKDPAFAAQVNKEKELTEAWNDSVRSGNEAIKRLTESLSALLGYVLIPVNRALGWLGWILHQIATVGSTIGNTFAKIGLKDVAVHTKQASMGFLGLFLMMGMVKKSGVLNMFSILNPRPLISGVMDLGRAFMGTTGQGNVFSRVLGALKDKLSPAAKSTEDLTAATEKMTPESGEGAKGFLEKLADGLTALSKVPAKNLAMVLLVLAGAFIVIGGTILGMAIVIKKFGLTAQDFLVAALGLALAAGVMIGAVALFGVLGAETTALAPLLLIAAIGIAVLGAAMLLAAVSTQVFATAFATVMDAWDGKKAFELLGWMVLAAPAIAMFGGSMLIAAPGLIAGAAGLAAASIGFLLISAVVNDSLAATLQTVAVATAEMAHGMLLFAAAALPFMAGAGVMAGATAALGLAMLLFPNKWFRHAAISMEIWSKAISRLPERSAAKIAAIRDVLKDLKNLPTLSADEATETANALDILSPRISGFAKATAELAGLGDIADRFSGAVDKIAAAMVRLKGFSETDFNASMSVVRAMSVDNAAIGTPLSTTKFSTEPAVAESSSKVEELLMAVRDVLGDIKTDALDRGRSLKDIVNHLKNDLPDAFLGSSSLTKEASDW
jgi:hypothetical protein